MEPQEIKKPIILIVDDDAFLQDMYALRFTKADFIVETALSADEALKKLRDGLVPNVCLLDIMMPGTDGFALLETINTEGLIKTTPKVFFSNLGQEEDLIRAKTLGAASYIIKASSTPSEVVDHIKGVLQSHGL